MDGVGKSSRLIETVDDVAGQTPFVMVHSKILVPTPREVIPVVARVGVVIIPPPDSRDHEPVPIVGGLPFIVNVVAQTV